MALSARATCLLGATRASLVVLEATFDFIGSSLAKVVK
jgi:hypothetical protein